ncbi:DUF6531 domain-containing protein [Sorangium sp. So ce362]
MNPGVWIMGGEGGGGGGNGRGGSGSGNGQGAGGGNGGNDAQGGGKGAGSCGPGSGAGCPNPSHGGGGGTHAGDPIDPVTGRVYTVPAVDLALPGPLPLVIKRTYSSTGSGEEHVLMRSPAGRIVEERTFDGRTIRSKHDLLGRIVQSESGSGEITEFKYDPVGRLVERAYADGTAEPLSTTRWDACCVQSPPCPRRCSGMMAADGWLQSCTG